MRRILAEHSGPDPLSVVTLSLNIPGPDKNLPGCQTVFARAAAAIEGATHASPLPLLQGPDATDVLGPFGIWRTPFDPRAVKLAALGIEDAPAGGRLADVDVYDGEGVQVDRARVGLPPRACFVCPEPAHECARLGRHAPEQLLSAVRALLADAFLEALAAALVSGAREELDLTPKPGLVDRLDNGSHPDLTFESMSRSIGLLPRYFRELRAVLAAGSPFEPAIERGSRHLAGREAAGRALRLCIDAGLRAERRMWDEVGTNAHRGYIFLGGLALLAAAARVPRTAGEYRAAIASLAARVLAGARDPSAPSHGDSLRRQHGLAGIHGEALAGLPAVFAHGRPALARALASGADRALAAHYAMAVLMQHLEDTTAVHRCGLDGLERIREDGRRIQAAIEAGDDHQALLARMNVEYRAVRLTMGGVADCLALSLALEGAGVVIAEGDPYEDDEPGRPRQG